MWCMMHGDLQLLLSRVESSVFSVAQLMCPPKPPQVTHCLTHMRLVCLWLLLLPHTTAPHDTHIHTCTQLFLVVNVRGGYEAVCTSFRWGDVCKCLSCDQSSQTVTAMRIAYERSLLEFEQYVRSGRYKAEQALNQEPKWIKADTDAAMQQAMRAGKVAAAMGAGGGGAPLAPRGAGVGGGPRGGALPLAAAGAGAAGGLLALPGGVQLMQAQAQLRLQQQAMLLAAQQQPGRPGQPAGQAVNAAATPLTVQQQLLLQQHQQLLQARLLQAGAAAGNPQLQTLLLQQQQAQLAAAANAARPAGAAATGVLTPAQIQQLQALQRTVSGAAAAGGGVQQTPAAAAAAAAAPPAQPQAPQPAASQPLPTVPSVNFSAMLDGL